MLGNLRLDKIKGQPVDKLFAEMRAKGLAAKSIKNIRATLRRILASAVEWEVIDAIPRLPKVKVADSKWDFLNQEESAKLLAATRSPEERTLLQFALQTGARAGEQLAFEWGDIDFANHLVIFRRSSTRGIVGHTKSGRERRVPLTPSLEAALKTHRHLKGKLVFCNPDGKPLSIWQLHERLWMCCRRAGLRESAGTTCGTRSPRSSSQPACLSVRCRTGSATRRSR